MKTAGEILNERAGRQITVADLIEFLREAREDMRQECIKVCQELAVFDEYDPGASAAQAIRAIENK